MTAPIAMEHIIKDKASVKTLTLLALQLKRGTLSGPEEIANATARALRSVVSAAKFASLEELIQIIRTAGRYLQQAQVRGERFQTASYPIPNADLLALSYSRRANNWKYHPESPASSS